MLNLLVKAFYFSRDHKVAVQSKNMPQADRAAGRKDLAKIEGSGTAPQIEWFTPSQNSIISIFEGLAENNGY